jgi:hypothetical protein
LRRRVVAHERWPHRQLHALAALPQRRKRSAGRSGSWNGCDRAAVAGNESEPLRPQQAFFLMKRLLDQRLVGL